MYIFLFCLRFLEMSHLSTVPNGHAKRPLIVLLLARINFDLLAAGEKQFSTNNLPAISVWACG